MVESNPPRFVGGNGHCQLIWDNLPKKIEPMRKEPMIDPVTFWVCAFGVVGLFWFAAIIYGVLTT